MCLALQYQAFDIVLNNRMENLVPSPKTYLDQNKQSNMWWISNGYNQGKISYLKVWSVGKEVSTPKMLNVLWSRSTPCYRSGQNPRFLQTKAEVRWILALLAMDGGHRRHQTGRETNVREDEDRSWRWVTNAGVEHLGGKGIVGLLSSPITSWFMYLYSKTEILYPDQTLTFLHEKLRVEKLELQKKVTQSFKSWQKCLLLRDFGNTMCLIFQKEYVELIEYPWKEKMPKHLKNNEKGLTSLEAEVW